MNKTEKIAFGIIIALAVLSIFLINFTKGNKEYKVIESIIDEVTNSEGVRMVYLASSDCEECELQKYQMKNLIQNYGLDYYYINLDELSNYKINSIYKKLDLEVSKDVPTIAIYNNGKLTTSLTGITGINRLHSMLVDETILDENELSLNYLTINSYVDKMKTDKLVLALGNYRNVDSNSFEEILWHIVSEYGVEINFIYLSDLTESEGKLFESKIINFDDYNLKIPSLLIIENQKIIDNKIELTEETDYVEFLKENGIIK